MSATDELRRLLDERGVDWREGDDERKTLWESNGLTWEYFNDENGDAWLGFLGACEQDITPEQAIAATLGGGKLTAEQVRELIVPHLNARPTFDFGRHGAVWSADFQAIADTLNATLGGGECVPHGEWIRISQTQEARHVYCECGYELGVDRRDSFPFKHTQLFTMTNYCPNCGRKIQREMER